MGLKVWLPFDGNLNNYGYGDVAAPTYNNLTLVSNGKIGQCYSGQAVYHLTNELLGNIWSLCAWIKADGWYSSNNVILCKNVAAGDAYQFYFSVVGGTQLRIGINNNSGIVFNYTFNTGTWYHIAATYDGNIGSLYINGELKKSSSISNAFSANMDNIGINCRSANADGTTRWIGDSSVHYINDARIYDHCLSAAEVREISQGLVLHYKLDSITNEIQDSSGYNHNGTIIGNIQLANNSSYYNYCVYNTDGGVNYIQTPALNMPTDAITMNIWFKTTSNVPTSDYHMIVDSVGNSSGRQHYEMAIYKTGYFRGGLFVNGARKADNCTSTTGCNGQWHMLTLSYDGTSVKRYFDGVMEKSTTIAITTGLQPTATLRLFKDGYSSYACINSSLSDFRIYCTALSETDIQQLYKLRAKVDNKQNLHLINLYENTDSSMNEEITYTNTGSYNISVGTYNYPATFSQTPTQRFIQKDIYFPEERYRSSTININPYNSFQLITSGGMRITSRLANIPRYTYRIVGYQQGRPLYQAYENGTYTYTALKYNLELFYLDSDGDVLNSEALISTQMIGGSNSIDINLSNRTFNISSPAVRFQFGHLFTSIFLEARIIGYISYNDNNGELYPEHISYPYQTKIKLKSNGNFICDTLYESETTQLLKNKSVRTNNLIEF